MGLFDWLKSKKTTSLPAGNPWKVGERVLAKKQDSYFYPGVVREPVKDSNWRIGDRVLARWLDFFWYPGTILNQGERGIHILFDDNDQRVVQDIMVMPLAIEEGEQLYIRPKSEPQRIYSQATV